MEMLFVLHLNRKRKNMKLSTLALGALISFNLNAIAQDKPKTVSQTKSTKTQKVKPKTCVKPGMSKTAANSLIVEEPKRKVCAACGRG